MKVIAITGGVASGKSTVADLFNKLFNIPIIDSDHIAHEILTSDQNVIDEIISKFPSVKTKEHKIDRKKFRDYIFTSEENKKWLEKLLHPLINSRLQQQVHKLSIAHESHKYCLVLIPLLTKQYLNQNGFINHVLVIDTDTQTQIARATQRDKQSPEQIQNIIDNQISRQERLSLADSIIYNTGTLNDLQKQVANLNTRYQSI